eukprot:6181532-Pleurochrysis_carterae.AAC.4
MAMVRPTELVTLCHACRSATIRSVPTAASITSSVYMRTVCMRASSAPTWSFRASRRRGGQTLGHIPCDECQLVAVREAFVAGEQEIGRSGEPVLRRRKAEVGEVVRHVIGDDEDAVAGQVSRVVEQGEVIGKVARGGLLRSNGCGNCPERSLMEGIRSPDSSARCFGAHPRPWSTSSGRMGEDVKPAARVHSPHLLLEGGKAIGEGDQVGEKHNLQWQVRFETNSMREVADHARIGPLRQGGYDVGHIEGQSGS